MTVGYPETGPLPVNRYGEAPGESNSDGGGSYTGYGRDETRIVKGRPVFDTFHMNGPNVDPFDAAQTEMNLVAAQVARWSEPSRRATLDQFSGLLAQYGHTNSPGTLWALAQSGLDPNSDALQQVLGTDSKAYLGDVYGSMPATVGSPVAAAGTESWFDDFWPDSIWSPFQAVSRNAFSAMSMPMEALQGAERNIGAALSTEDGGGIPQALQAVGEYLAPPLAFLTDQGDDYQNPWEQTEFGQQILFAQDNGWGAALGSGTAGLDVEKAYQEILLDPQYAAMVGTTDEPKLNALATQVAKEKGYYSSPGWFIDETSQIGEAQRQSTFNAWAIPGPNGSMTAWTLGRGIMSNVGGPDWAGYGVASGIIDMANAFVDPTIVGAKFGVVSKTLRGVGVVAEKVGVAGAERALTVGKEAAKVRQGIGVTNRNSDILVKEYNRLAAKTGIVDPLTLDEWALMDIEGQAATVRGMKDMQAVDSARRAVSPDQQAVWNAERDRRRWMSATDRGAEHSAVAADDAFALERQADMWGEFLGAAYRPAVTTTAPPARKWAQDPKIPGVTIYGDYSVRNVSRGKWEVTVDGQVQEFPSAQAARTFAREQQQARDAAAVPTGNAVDTFDQAAYQAWYDTLTPDDQALWNDSMAWVETQVKAGKITAGELGTAEDLAMPGLVSEALQRRAKNLRGRAPKSQYAKRADADAARMVISGQADAALKTLDGVDYAGVTIPEAPVGGAALRGISDGEDALVYWTGSADPSLVDVDMIVPVEIVAAVRAMITDVMSRPGAKPNLPDLDPADSSLAHGVNDLLREFVDPEGYIGKRLDNENVTYGTLLNTLARTGFEGWLDNILREQFKIDGIAGINARTRGGVWMGDHPLLENYKWPSNAVDNAQVAAASLDTEAVLASLARTAQRTGLRSLSLNRAERFVRDAGGQWSKSNAQAQRRASVAMDTARAHQARLDADRAGIARRFDDPEEAVRQVLQHEAGMVAGNGRSVLMSKEGVRWFLFGNGPMAYLKNKVFDRLATFLPEKEVARLKAMDPESPAYKEAYEKFAALYMGRLRGVTNGSWDGSTYKAIFDNAFEGGGTEGVLRVLAPRLGVDVSRGDLSRGLKVMDGDGTAKTFRTWRTQNNIVKRKLARMMSERPNSRLVDMENVEDVADAIVKYGMYAKLDEATISNYVGRVMLHDGQFDSIEQNVDVLKALFNDIGDSLIKRLETGGIIRGERLDEMKHRMERSVKLFLAGEKGNYDRIAKWDSGVAPYVLDENGVRLSLPELSIDSELLTGSLALPSVDEWGAAINRYGQLMHKTELSAGIYDKAQAVFDNLFRTSLLILRFSYIIRNSAEMQIRMFLNGHHSVLSDPITLTGMTIGAFSTKRSDSLRALFAPYSDTVLGTGFEVGNDEALAIANHVQDYFATTRQSHSLTDPRVYQSGVRSGWQAVGWESDAFHGGWANELIMLHRSEITRRVAGEESPEQVVAWLLSDAQDATKLRRRMEASNGDFKAIFRSEAATRDYLYDSPNSILNRINNFTYNDPSLLAFIKTGTYSGEGRRWNMNSVVDIKERVSGLRRILSEKYKKGTPAGDDIKTFFDQRKVTVPWNDTLTSQKRGSGIADAFFGFANKIERLGSVGPEFRMAYWDEIAKIAPGLRAQDVDKALEAARTTLTPLKRMNPDGKMVEIGSNHPAWEALAKAKRENTDGLLTLDEIHTMASKVAADSVKDLFYDAARRNNMWAATRLIFPFGQAWGNTARKWGELGAQSPVQVYKVQKAFNAMLQSGSSAVYELGQDLGAYGEYAPGFAPWEQDANGGFLYTNRYGDSSFTTPFLGRAAAIPVNMMSALNGFDAGISDIPLESSAKSINLMGDAIPGVSVFGAMALDLLSDSDVVASIQQISQPFGEQGVTQSIIPAWLAKSIGGVGVVPGLGGPAEGFLSVLSPQYKNKFVRDATAILSSSGDYDPSDPQSAQELKEDAKNLGLALLLTTGLFQNVMPTTPSPMPLVDLSQDDFKGTLENPSAPLYAVSLINAQMPMYVAANGGDQTLAREQILREYGPGWLFAVTGNTKGGQRVPSSQALTWARQHPEDARAYSDYFPLMFPKGDPSDVIARKWLDDNTSEKAQAKTSEEIVDETIMTLMRVRKARIDFMEGNRLIPVEEAEEMRKVLAEQFANTKAGTLLNTLTTGEELLQARNMLDSIPSLRSEPAAVAFMQAWAFRADALAEARSRSGRDNTTLSGEGVIGIKSAYDKDIEALIRQYPDFILLGNMMLREWD